MVTADQLRRQVDTILDTLAWANRPHPITPTVRFWAADDGKRRQANRPGITTRTVAHSDRYCGRARLDHHELAVDHADLIAACPKCADSTLRDALADAVVHRAAGLYQRDRAGTQRTASPVAARYELAGLAPRLRAHAQLQRPLSPLAAALADVAELTVPEANLNAVAIAALGVSCSETGFTAGRIGFVVPGVDMRLFGSQHPTKLWCSSNTPWWRHGLNLLGELASTRVADALNTMAAAVITAGPPNVGCFDPVILDPAALASAASNGAWLAAAWEAAVDVAFDTTRAWLDQLAAEPAVRVVVSGKPADLADWLTSNDLFIVFHMIAGCRTTPADGRFEYVGPPVIADFLHRCRRGLRVEVHAVGEPGTPEPDQVRVANVLWEPDGDHLARYSDALEAAQLVAAA